MITHFLPSPFSPVPSCLLSRSGLQVQVPGNNANFFTVLRLLFSPPSLFAFPTPAPVALFLHPQPEIQLESKTH